MEQRGRRSHLCGHPPPAYRVKVVCVEGEVGAVSRSGFHYRRPRFESEQPRQNPLWFPHKKNSTTTLQF